ncbi:MAG: sulfotransferase domain-containing protein [Chloroflexota bacterium]|nr:sulfotransferase domain-containing protein [Chloroflexota bacterium]
MHGRAFVTSIPKCGKNVVRSLLPSLGLSQVSTSEMPVAASHVYARWLRATQPRGRHPSVDAIIRETRPAFEHVLGLLGELPGGRYVQGHFAYDEELHAAVRAARIPIVLVYRDPRACLASLAHYLVERGEPADFLPRLRSRDVPSALRLLLDGDEAVVPFEHFFAPYDGWRRAEGVLALRFEDLIGPRGGGSRTRQFATIIRLAAHLGWRGAPWQLVSAAKHAFNPRAGTYRRGTIDGWREDLDGRLRAEDWPALHELAGRWGYRGDTTPRVAALAGMAHAVAARAVRP